MAQQPDSSARVDRDDEAVDELLNETRLLRRKVNFWQRAVWLLLGTAVIFLTVIWQRGELRSRECRQSLEHYGEQARHSGLSDQHNEILEQQWQFMEQGLAKVPPIHYDLVVENWRKQPGPGEVLPLAVCRESHFLALSRGRHVLLRDGDKLRVEWWSEEQAAPVARDAAADNRAR